MLFILLSLTIWSGMDIEDSCDMIELNHYHDTTGNHVFDQIIFWRYDVADGYFHVREWTMSDNKISLIDTQRAIIQYCDTAHGPRVISAKVFKESWTQVDPERKNLRYVPQSEGYSLSKGGCCGFSP